jgi:hypothetical protein
VTVAVDLTLILAATATDFQRFRATLRRAQSHATFRLLFNAILDRKSVV